MSKHDELRKRVEAAGRYVDFAKLKPEDLETAKELVQQGDLSPLMSRRVDGIIIPNTVHALIDKENPYSF